MRPFSLSLEVCFLALLAGVVVAYQGVVRAAAPDPSVVYANGNYYMTYTAVDHIEIIRSRTLRGLLIGSIRIAYVERNATRDAYMWAPELHQIDGVWYIFYSSGNGSQECWESCRPRVLEGCNAATPYYCGWRWRADLVPPAGRQGGSDGRDPFAIDASFLEVPGWGRYSLVSARNGRAEQSVQISPLDTRTWNVTGWSVISEPEAPWERNVTGSRPRELWIGDIAVNEGPHALYHNNEIWITFSGSHCQTPNYAIGILKWNGGDPTLKSSWTKSSAPVLSQANGNYGTGHNSFFQSPDGTQTWMAFHATASRWGACDDSRYAMAQLVQFNGNSTPTFGVPRNLDDVAEAPSGENFTSQSMDEGEMPLEKRNWL